MDPILHAGPNAAGLDSACAVPFHPDRRWFCVSAVSPIFVLRLLLADDGTTVNQSQSLTEETCFKGIIMNTSDDNGGRRRPRGCCLPPRYQK